jgi:hypothetical protein
MGSVTVVERRCPHPNIAYCPLYRAAHEAGGPSCDDGRLGEHDGCSVDRGVDYGRTLAALWKVKPELIREAAESESAAMAQWQREKNMRAAGLH